MKHIISLLLILSLSGYAHSDSDDHEPMQKLMLGTWENVTNGDTIGLKLLADGACEIYIERSYQNRSIKTCKYEPFKQQYVVFLVKADGTCGNNPDFEFAYEPEAPLVRLFIQGSPVILSKPNESGAHVEVKS